MAHKDPRGNVIALTNAESKSVGRSYTYTSWGELHTGSDAAGFNDLDRARWKGALWFDEIGLYYMRARWYDPSLGRFVSEDPIGLDGGINPYAFAAADPINGSDPTGLDWICVTDGKGLIEKCWWRFDDIEVVVPGPGNEGNWWDREADLFGPDNGGDAGEGFGRFGGRRNGFEVHWERMRLVEEFYCTQELGWFALNTAATAMSFSGAGFSAGMVVRGGARYLSGRLVLRSAVGDLGRGTMISGGMAAVGKIQMSTGTLIAAPVLTEVDNWLGLSDTIGAGRAAWSCVSSR